MSLLVDKFSTKYYPMLCATPNTVMGFVNWAIFISQRGFINDYYKVNTVD